MRHYPETPPPGIPPEGVNKHLLGVWYEVRNSIVRDQQVVEQNLNQVKNCKNTIRFLKERVVVQKAALEQLSKVKENG